MYQYISNINIIMYEKCQCFSHVRIFLSIDNLLTWKVQLNKKSFYFSIDTLTLEKYLYLKSMHTWKVLILIISSIDIFQVSIHFKYWRYQLFLSTRSILVFVKYRKYQYFSNIITFQVSILLKHRKSFSCIKRINNFQVSKVSILFQYQHFSNINVWKVLTLFKYQYCLSISYFQVSRFYTHLCFSNIYSFQVSILSILFKYHRRHYFSSILSINIFQVLKVSTFFKY